MVLVLPGGVIVGFDTVGIGDGSGVIVGGLTQAGACQGHKSKATNTAAMIIITPMVAKNFAGPFSVFIRAADGA